MPDLSPLLDTAWFWFFFGVVLTLAAVLWVAHFTITTKSEDNRSSDIPVQASIEFFATIDALRSQHLLSETFKPGNEVHAYFLSGEGVFAEHNDYIKCVKRLILPNPDATNIATLQTLSNSYVDFKSQIAKSRALAMKNNVPVRLFQDFIGVSFLFCNPERQDGWVQVGIIIPGSESSERQHYRLYRPKHEKAVLSLYKTFDRLWEASITKTEQEEFDSGYAGESAAMLSTENHASPKIDYKFEEVPHDGYFKFDEYKPGEPCPQCYSIKIVNPHPHSSISNVQVKLETIEEIEMNAGTIKNAGLQPKNVGYHLTFKKSGTNSITILGNDSEWVPVLSFRKNDCFISIEGVDKRHGTVNFERKIMSPYKPHRIEIVVRGDNAKEDRASFFVQVDDIGRLIMKRL